MLGRLASPDNSARFFGGGGQDLRGMLIPRKRRENVVSVGNGDAVVTDIGAARARGRGCLGESNISYLPVERVALVYTSECRTDAIGCKIVSLTAKNALLPLLPAKQLIN